MVDFVLSLNRPFVTQLDKNQRNLFFLMSDVCITYVFDIVQRFIPIHAVHCWTLASKKFVPNHDYQNQLFYYYLGAFFGYQSLEQW